MYAPYWNQEARGIICGIHEDTNKGHIVRAALEAVCFQVRDILDSMNQDSQSPITKLQVDGGECEICQKNIESQIIQFLTRNDVE